MGEPFGSVTCPLTCAAVSAICAKAGAAARPEQAATTSSITSACLKWFLMAVVPLS
jgi:hypothetical protein